MLSLGRDKIIDYYVDEVMFNMPRLIWELALPEVFPEKYDSRLQTLTILSALRYLFATMCTEEFISSAELDKVISFYMVRPFYRGKPSEQTIRAVREEIVGYEKTDSKYQELCMESKKSELKDYIREKKKGRRAHGLGWFMAIKGDDKNDKRFYICPFDKTELECRVETNPGKANGNDASKSEEQTSTRKNITVVWNSVTAINKDINNGNEFRERLKSEFWKCSENAPTDEEFAAKAFEFTSELKVWSDGTRSTRRPLRVIVANLIREKLREKGFDDLTDGLFQRRPLQKQDDPAFSFAIPPLREMSDP